MTQDHDIFEKEIPSSVVIFTVHESQWSQSNTNKAERKRKDLSN